MKVITYLGFTLLSVFIQFCVMDYIQEKFQTNENIGSDSVASIVRDDVLRNITSKPHALYYRTLTRRSIKGSSTAVTNAPDKTSSISTLLFGTSDASTTIFDILYDENTSTTETAATEMLLTTNDIDNITETTYFETKNKSSTPNTVRKISSTNDCGCNLLYEICDVNCCCDLDCTDQDKILFECERKENDSRHHKDGCITHLLGGNRRYDQSVFDTLFCVVKTNLPDRLTVTQPNLALINKYNKWISIPQVKTSYEFKKAAYIKGDPIWLLKNGTIYYLDLAAPMVNDYCTDRAPIIFLKNQVIRCKVNYRSLEMFHIGNNTASMVISATDRSFNSSTLNCSNLHCVNWTILTCHIGDCRLYNKSSDEASCTDSTCINLALRVDYNFYYYDSKIVNATIKLHVQNLSNSIPFMLQEITINFIISNNTLRRIIEFSGNPGYINRLPIIISNAVSNYTDNFINGATDGNYMGLPGNQNGKCVPPNIAFNVVRFGINKRTKCRYIHPHVTSTSKNASMLCKSIQENIKSMLGLGGDIALSPLGNPHGIKDENWIKLQYVIEKQDLYGEYSENIAKLRCYNLINGVTLLFLFANVNDKSYVGQNKILMTKFNVATSDVYFHGQDLSTVLTVDINFVDASNPHHYVYASSPHLNIHLPKDFFFPFSPNHCNHISYSYIVICCCIITCFANKITLQL